MNKPPTRSLFTIGSVIGVGLTGILAAWGGMKAKDVIDNAEAGIDKHELKKKIALRMAPAAVAGVATAGTIIASHRLGTKEILGLTATVGYLVKNRTYLERKLEENVGKEKVEAIKQKFVEEYHQEIQDALPKRKKFPAEETGHGDLLCFHMPTGRWFRSSEEAVDSALRTAEALAETTPLSENDIYLFYGIEPSDIGDMFGYPRNSVLDNRTLIFHTNLIKNDKEKGEDILYIEADSMAGPVIFYDDPAYDLS